MFPTGFETYGEHRLTFSLKKKSLKDIFNFEICYKFDQFLNNSKSNRARSLKMVFRFAPITDFEITHHITFWIVLGSIQLLYISYDYKNVVVIEC